MTTSPERSGAAPWYCSHESSRAATSTMVAAGLVATAALMAFVGLLVAGDEVSALVAAMVMLVAAANTWSAGRSRTWWRADPASGREVRAAPAPSGATAPTGTAAPSAGRPLRPLAAELPLAAERPPQPIATPPVRPVPDAPAPRPRVAVTVAASPRPTGAPGPAPAPAPQPAPAPRNDQGHVRQEVGPRELRGVPVAAGAARPAPVLDDQGHVRQEVGSRELRGVPVAAGAARPAPARAASEATRSGDDPDERTTSSRAGRTAAASATRTRRRTAPVRPVSRRVAGTRSS
jgi:hypothetical protein